MWADNMSILCEPLLDAGAFLCRLCIWFYNTLLIELNKLVIEL